MADQGKLRTSIRAFALPACRPTFSLYQKMASTTANLPKTLKIHTSDHEIVEVTENVINGCENLKMVTVKHPEFDEFVAPFKSSGFKNAFKFLEFFDLNEPSTPSFDYLAFIQATKPAMKFLHGLSEEDKAELLYTMNCLQCKRLDDCMKMYSTVVNDNYKIEEFGEIPDSMEIFMSNDKTITVPRKIVKESDFLISFYKAFGSFPGRLFVGFSGHAYHKALKALNLCDLDTPHVPLEIASIAPITPALSAFAKANQHVMDYFNSLMNLDLYEITIVASFMSIRRLCDLFLVYLMTLDEDRRERILRGHSAISEYFYHLQENDEENSDYVFPADGA
uniref:NR LBD domain-containing protein n=1 Tax=Panagrellus redivivus TaxID=6233 RepID=A0A7E4W9K7_PANRE